MKKSLKVFILALITVLIIIGLTGCAKSATKKAIDSATEKMSEQEKKFFNSQFEMYKGEVDGSRARQLYNTVELSNERSERQVEIKGITDISKISTSKKYNVSIEKDKNDIVSVITVKEK